MSKSKGSTYLYCMTEQNSRGLLCRSKLSRALSKFKPYPADPDILIHKQKKYALIWYLYFLPKDLCFLRPIWPIVKCSEWPKLHFHIRPKPKAEDRKLFGLWPNTEAECWNFLKLLSISHICSFNLIFANPFFNPQGPHPYLEMLSFFQLGVESLRIKKVIRGR